MRNELGLTGTKEGCGIGVCGSCSVLVDGRLISACLTLAPCVDGCNVQTIEGIAQEKELTALQDELVIHGGLQCGICTPGQVVAATALLAEKPHPSPDDVKEWMMGNLCRCTGYYQIAEAIIAASQRGGTRG